MRHRQDYVLGIISLKINIHGEENRLCDEVVLRYTSTFVGLANTLEIAGGS